MRELAMKVKGLDVGHWITIISVILAASINYGNITAQIGELSRSQIRVEASLGSMQGKLEGVVAEQARVRQQLEDHIQKTNERFREVRNR
jgi:hypothetical protein